jgi:Rrf2 family protein
MRLQLTRRADYAIRAMLALGRHDGEDPLSSRRIADEMAIPGRFLPQVMADLSRARLVDATTGRTGGYRLARSADRISLFDIVSAIEGDSRTTECVLRGGPCGRDGHCDVHDVFTAAQQSLLDTLAQASLASVVGRRRPAPRRATPGRLPPNGPARQAERHGLNTK